MEEITWDGGQFEANRSKRFRGQDQDRRIFTHLSDAILVDPQMGNGRRQARSWSRN